jgi:hypothetical protein
MTSVEQAKELLSLVTTPSALVTGTFLAFAGRAISDNERMVSRVRMWFALGASLAAVGVASALTGLMIPLAVRSGLSDQGTLSPVLVVFWMISVSVVGTALYGGWTVWRCIAELRRPDR